MPLTCENAATCNFLRLLRPFLQRSLARQQIYYTTIRKRLYALMSMSRSWLNRWLGLYLVCTMFDQNQQITYIRVQQCAIDMSPMRDHEMFKQCLNRQTSTSRRLKGTQSQPCECSQSVIFCQILFHNVLFKSYSINANASKRIFVCFFKRCSHIKKQYS